MKRIIHFLASHKARVHTRIAAGVAPRFLPLGLTLALVLLLLALPASGLQPFTASARHNVGDATVTLDVSNTSPTVGETISGSGAWWHNTKTVCEAFPDHWVGVDWGNDDDDIVEVPCNFEDETDPHPYSGIGTSYSEPGSYQACATLYHAELNQDVVTTCVDIDVQTEPPPEEEPPADDETSPPPAPAVGNIAACADGLNPVVAGDQSLTPSVPGEWLTLVGFTPGTYTVTSGSRSASVTVQAGTIQAPSEEEWGSCTPASEVLGAQVQSLPQTGFAPVQGLEPVTARALVSAAMVAAGWALRRLVR